MRFKTAGDRVYAGLCPETERPLRGMDVRGWANKLYPSQTMARFQHDPRSAEARERKALLLAYADKQDAQGKLAGLEE